PEAALIALAIFDAVARLLMALERPQPKLVGTDDGDRFLLDERFGREVFAYIRRRREVCAAASELCLQAEARVDLLDLFGQPLGLKLLRTHKLLQLLLL